MERERSELVVIGNVDWENKRVSRTGVTIVELLVVLAIIGVMVAVLMPAVQRTREAARETVCRNNVGQINLALSQYAEVADIPAANSDATISGWTIEILPFLEQANLKDSIPVGRPTSELPKQHYKQPRILRCPTQVNLRAAADSISPAHYVMITNGDRSSFLIADAPISFSRPWSTSPELESTNEIGTDGPHNMGYFWAAGFQHGVNFAHPDR